MTERVPMGEDELQREKKKKKHRSREGSADGVADEDGARREKKKKKHRTAEGDGEVNADGERKKKKKHRDSTAGEGEDRKKKKSRDEETPEEREERRRKRKEKKEREQAAADAASLPPPPPPDMDTFPSIDDLPDDRLPDHMLENPPVPLVDPGRPEANERIARPPASKPGPPPVAAKPHPPVPAKPKIAKPKQPEPQHRSESDEEGPRMIPQQPPQPQYVPQQPAQPRVVPQQPAQPKVVPQQPAQPKVVPQQPAQPRVVPQQPAQPRVVPQQPAQPKVVPQQPAQPQYVPQQPAEPPYIPQPQYFPQQPAQPRVSQLAPEPEDLESDPEEVEPEVIQPPPVGYPQVVSHPSVANHQDLLDDDEDEDAVLDAAPPMNQQPPMRPPPPTTQSFDHHPSDFEDSPAAVQDRYSRNSDFFNRPPEDQYNDEVPSVLMEPPIEPVQHQEKPKSGGILGKLFSSFRKKNRPKVSKQRQHPAQRPDVTQPGIGEQQQWTSNPNIFNAGLETRENTLQRGQPHTLGGPAGVGVRPLTLVPARVILLDGEEIEVPVERKALGVALMDRVCDHLDLCERDYFGMTFVDAKERMWYWLDPEKKIHKQIRSGEPWFFNFQVKFYPPEPSLLKEDVSRYQLCLQLRQDVFTGKLPCSWITQALLGSFVVQSELGDHEPNEHGSDYLKDMEFVHNQTPELLTKVAELHTGHAGLTPEQADLRYLETSRRLELYGVDLHPARDLDDVDINIGVCFGGVVVYKDRMRISRFAWPKILRISYRKNLFYLKIRSDMYENVEALVGFKLMNHKWAKRLWKIAIDHHTFFRLKEPQLNDLRGSRTSLNSLFGGSKHRFSGRTFHQYRTLAIDRSGGTGTFDRSMSKRRSASLPSLNKGSQYGSFHSLNRAHPRDMRPTTSGGTMPPAGANLVARTGSVSVLPTSAFNNRVPSRSNSITDDLL